MLSLPDEGLHHCRKVNESFDYLVLVNSFYVFVEEIANFQDVCKKKVAV
jgi:hypothetical protein